MPAAVSGASTTTYFSQGGSVTNTGGSMSAAAFGATAPVQFGASSSAGVKAIATTVSIGTPGGTITLNQSATQSELTWLGQNHAVMSSYSVTQSSDPAIGANTGTGHILDYSVTSNLTYTDYGAWSIDPSTSATNPAYVGAYAGGKPGQLATASVPKSGTAIFNGGAAGFVSVNSGAGAGKVSPWSASAQMTANFATGTVTGSVTGIQAFGLGRGGGASIGTVNDIALAGTLSGSSLTGTASASSAFKGTAFDISGATGTVSGSLYGPAAQELAGTFNLSGGTNGATVLGSFGTSTANAAPSDRRLKTAIRLVGQRPDGLRLYSWRYKGSRRHFVGPIAQDLLADPRFAAAVLAGSNGFLWVDFDKLGMGANDVSAMRREGERAIARLSGAS
jgi:hypothetical protein